MYNDNVVRLNKKVRWYGSKVMCGLLEVKIPVLGRGRRHSNKETAVELYFLGDVCLHVNE